MGSIDIINGRFVSSLGNILGGLFEFLTDLSGVGVGSGMLPPP